MRFENIHIRPNLYFTLSFTVSRNTIVHYFVNLYFTLSFTVSRNTIVHSFVFHTIFYCQQKYDRTFLCISHYLLLSAEIRSYIPLYFTLSFTVSRNTIVHSFVFHTIFYCQQKYDRTFLCKFVFHTIFYCQQKYDRTFLCISHYLLLSAEIRSYIPL